MDFDKVLHIATFAGRDVYKRQATALSPSKVSGLVVAISKNSSEPTTGYLICQKFPSFSSYSISASDKAV